MTILCLLIGVRKVQLSQRDIQYNHASCFMGIESVICDTSPYKGAFCGCSMHEVYGVMNATRYFGRCLSYNCHGMTVCCISERRIKMLKSPHRQDRQEVQYDLHDNQRDVTTHTGQLIKCRPVSPKNRKKSFILQIAADF